MLPCQRDLFSLPPGLHFLNAARMTPLLRTVEAAGVAGVRRKTVPTEITAETFFDDVEAVRERFGRLVEAPAADVALAASASYGMAAVANNVALGAGQTVVVVGDQFPSNVYPWRRLAADAGATVRTVAAPDAARRGQAWNAALLDAIGPETALVSVPHVHWSDGTRFDLAAVGDRARAVGAVFVVDGTQSVGALPFSVAALRPDALVCSAYKWLMGPYGAALAVYGERFADGVPVEETWISRRGARDFSALSDYTDAYAPGAVRYDVGGRSNPVTVPMLRAGLDQLLDWTPAAVQAYASALSDRLCRRAGDLGWTSESAGARCGHLVGLRPPAGTDLAAVHAGLAARGVRVSVRGDALRVSPHLYNDDADVDALLDGLAALA